MNDKRVKSPSNLTISIIAFTFCILMLCYKFVQLEKRIEILENKKEKICSLEK